MYVAREKRCMPRARPSGSAGLALATPSLTTKALGNKENTTDWRALGSEPAEPHAETIRGRQSRRHLSRVPEIAA